jgi:hypothetical protein
MLPVGFQNKDRLDLADLFRRERTYTIPCIQPGLRVPGDIHAERPRAGNGQEMRCTVLEDHLLVLLPEPPGMLVVMIIESGPERTDSLKPGCIGFAIFYGGHRMKIRKRRINYDR